MPRKNAYCFTLNNFTPAERLRLEQSDPNVRYIVFGEEVGENGTPHLQGYLQLKAEENLVPLRRRLFNDRAHLELAGGSAEQNRNYCTKDATNIYERGTARSGKRGDRTDLELVQEAINGGKSYEEIVDEHFGVCAKYDRFVRQRILERDTQLHLEGVRASLSTVVLRPWQQRLLTILSEVPHPRHVMWLWESVGGQGKSFMARYLMATTSTLVLEAGRKTDLAHIVATQVPFPTTVVFDLARTTAPEESTATTGTSNFRLDSIYSIMESLKNGYLISTKYNSTTLTFKVPHVVVFANYPPDQSKMSADRWQISVIS